MRYHIKHDAQDHFSEPVVLAHHLLHLRPRDCPWQQVERFGLDIAPQPAGRREGSDGFGNPAVHVEITEPYSELRLASEVVCGVVARPWAGRSSELVWEQVRDLLAFTGPKATPSPIEAQRYQFESPNVHFKSELASYAGASFLPGRFLLDGCADLMHRIHSDVSYRPGEGNPSVIAVLEQRRGSHQDLAHLMIGCLRSVGLAARYVAGYLRTDPPAGERRRTGGDATHSWLAAYVPELGWVEFDPCNDCLADQRHIVLGWGRDFSDISPLRAVIQGGGEHTRRLAVTVTPLDEPPRSETAH
jgi:transglutaminase-like putative cysteine protease